MGGWVASGARLPCLPGFVACKAQDDKEQGRKQDVRHYTLGHILCNAKRI